MENNVSIAIPALPPNWEIKDTSHGLELWYKGKFVRSQSSKQPHKEACLRDFLISIYGEDPVTYYHG